MKISSSLAFFYLFATLITILRVGGYYLTDHTLPDGTRVRISSQITSDPKDRGSSYLIEIKDYYVYLDKAEHISLGDTVVVEGVVAGNALKNPKMVEHKTSDNILYRYRSYVLDFIGKNLPKNDAALISGMVLGSSIFLGQEFWGKLVATSTAHVVVASGMNVSLVAAFVLSFSSLIGRKVSLYIALITVWIYVFLAGFEAPLVRAGVMGTLFLWSQRSGREAHTIHLLFLTCLIMLLIKPTFFTDYGFILSVVSTLFLILFATKLYKKLNFVPLVFRENFATSVAAQIGVAPILFFGFGNFNILGPAINALVLWTVPYITIIGMIASGLVLVFPAFAKLLFYLIYPLTQFFIHTIDIFA